MISYEDKYKECLKTNKVLRDRLQVAENKLDKLRMDLNAD